MGLRTGRGADLLRRLVDECADPGIALKAFRFDPAYVHQLTRSKTESGCTLQGIVITADAFCVGRIQVELKS